MFNNTTYPTYLLAEANHDLVALFNYLKTEKEVFIAYCQLLFNPQNNSAIRYYELRKIFNQCTDPRERAALFLYLNRHGYNGLCRYNQQGIYNVPFGSFIKPYFPEKEIHHFCEKSQDATFIHSDFRQTFTHAQAHDLIYCDPPYAPLVQSSNFSAYTANKFGEQEQIILADLARENAARGITVLISNHDTAFTRKLYLGADMKSFSVRRLISCSGSNRVPVRELLAVFRG